MTTRQRIEAEKAGIPEDAAATGAELRRLHAILDHIAESAIVSHVCFPSTPFAGCCQTTWGCGICQGASLGYDRSDGRGAYEHRDWCPRKP